MYCDVNGDKPHKASEVCAKCGKNACLKHFDKKADLCLTCMEVAKDFLMKATTPKRFNRNSMGVQPDKDDILKYMDDEPFAGYMRYLLRK